MVVELTTETTPAAFPLMTTMAPAAKFAPVRVMVSPPRIFAAVSSPG